MPARRLRYVRTAGTRRDRSGCRAGNAFGTRTPAVIVHAGVGDVHHLAASGYIGVPELLCRWIKNNEAFLRLIETNADLQGVLGVTAADFEAAWQSYVRQRYLTSVQSV